MGKRGPKPKDVCAYGHDMTDPDNVGVKKVSSDSDREERFCVPCQRRRVRESDEKRRLSKRQETLRPDIRVMDEIVYMRGMHDLSGAAGVVVTTGWISA